MRGRGNGVREGGGKAASVALRESHIRARGVYSKYAASASCSVPQRGDAYRAARRSHSRYGLGLETGVHVTMSWGGEGRSSCSAAGKD